MTYRRSAGSERAGRDSTARRIRRNGGPPEQLRARLVASVRWMSAARRTTRYVAYSRPQFFIRREQREMKSRRLDVSTRGALGVLPTHGEQTART